MLGFAAIAIFLLACTNIASLLVVRTAGRQNELSVRTALGASAARLSRQLLIEHLVLASVAAVAADRRGRPDCCGCWSSRGSCPRIRSSERTLDAARDRCSCSG